MKAWQARRGLRSPSLYASGMWLLSPATMSSCIQYWTSGDARRRRTTESAGNQAHRQAHRQARRRV